MNIDVKEMLEGKVNITSFRYVETLETMEGLMFDDLPEVEGKLKRIERRKLLLACKVKTRVLLECSRCLDVYPQELEFSYEEVYTEEPLRIIGKLTEEDFKYTIENNMVDVSKSVRENIIMNLPIKPLCREDCKGLCPVCGKNLNREKCNCNLEDITIEY
ncbi:MAG: DUF177 domain-containing protein [bacterium]|nr:DUF177 domain-containing protein [bacterium]